MPLDYRRIDDVATQKAELTAAARVAEHEAYTAEFDVDRLTAEKAPQKAISDRAEEAERLRKIANGKAARSKLPRRERSEVRRNLVDNWLQTIEGTYAKVEAQRDDDKAALEDGGLDETTVDDLTDTVEKKSAELETLAAVHAVLVERWDALGGKTLPKVGEPIDPAKLPEPDPADDEPAVELPEPNRRQRRAAGERGPAAAPEEEPAPT